jgi:hypothetical protein
MRRPNRTPGLARSRPDRARRAALLAAAAAGALLAPAPAVADDMPDIGKLAGFIRWGGVALSVIVIVGAMIALRVVGDLAARLSKRFTNRRPTIQKIESTTRFALIAGITIMFDRPFHVGDRVSYAGQYGDIVKIGLRSVRMNTLDHNLITIPNNKVLTDVTSSGNYGALVMQVAMDFYIGVDQDAKLAAELVREACLTSPYVYLDRPVPVLVRQTLLESYAAIHLKARPYVFDCKYEKPFETDVHLRVLDAFRSSGILPPAVLFRKAGADLADAHPAPVPRPSGPPS